MGNKGPFINELPQSGEVTLLAVVLEKDLRPKRNGGSFLALRFADRSGELDGKVWENPETVSQSFERDDVVKVRGMVEVYNDKPQLIVSRIRRCDSEEYNAVDFYASSARDPDEMFGELQGFVAMVRDDALRELLNLITDDPAIGSRLKSAPAALKIHHAFRGGLLEHILSLCNLGVALCAHYPRLNLDFLIAGAILRVLSAINRPKPAISHAGQLPGGGGILFQLRFSFWRRGLRSGLRSWQGQPRAAPSRSRFCLSHFPPRTTTVLLQTCLI
jgi:3'-5' exoribonuclease